MNYEAFVNSIKMRLHNSATEDVFFGVFAATAIALAVLFALFLWREYVKKKRETDTFDTSFAKNLQYPGFYPGGAPKKHEKPRPEHDKWGDVDDEL